MSKSLAELVAELEDPVPKDVDPEAFESKDPISESENTTDENAGRGHYESVGKSKLRKPEEPFLGARYSGLRVSRDDLDEDDDPFAREGNLESDEEDNDEVEYDDPDEVDLDAQDEDDEEIDSDEAFEDGEEELFRKKGFTFKDSGKSTREVRKAGSLDQSVVEDDTVETSSQGDSDQSSSDANFDELQVDETDESDENESEEDDLSANDFETSKSETVKNDALQAMRNAEQKNIVSKLSGAIRSDVVKGQAVKKQYANFDTIVGTRVHLQKALIAANSLSATHTRDVDTEKLASAAEAAEKAAIEVLNSLSALLHSVQTASLDIEKNRTVLGKRPFSATLSSSMQDIRQAVDASYKAMKVQRRSVLSKWDLKTQPVKISSNTLRAKTKDNGLVGALDEHLYNRDRLVQKTRIPRSCAPIQQAGNHDASKNSINAHDRDVMDVDSGVSRAFLPIYDDADFYALLLTELIDHKKSYTSSIPNSISSTTLASATTPSNLLRDNKTKRANVDTKASKGRKMRYTIHEKLQNFMAPVDLGTWERRQAEELFAGLLGRRIAHLNETDEVVEVADDQENLEMQGLRLFGGR